MCSGTAAYRAMPAEFRIESLSTGFKNVAALSHGSRKTFFEQMAADLDQFLPPLPQTMTADSIRFQSRLFALLAVRPVVEAGTSQVYAEQVLPNYKAAITQYGIASLTDLSLTNENSLSAAVTLGAILKAAASETPSDTDRAIVLDQAAKTGLLISTGAKPSAVMAFLAQGSTLNPILTAWLQNPEMKSYSVAYQAVITYLQVKMQ